MPYMREGASKVSDHWVRSPLLNVNRACQTCHRASEEEMKARVDVIQQRNYDLLQRGGAAIVDLIDALVAAKANGTPPDVLDKARKLQQKAQWRLDFIAAENSMGFHAPQEAAKVLGEAADYARQGQVVLLGGVATAPAGAAMTTPAGVATATTAGAGAATPAPTPAAGSPGAAAKPNAAAPAAASARP
jgi:nitrite reductase (cytochrome c-552)